MTNKDSVEFAKLFAGLAQAFDKQASDLLIQIYFDSLKDFSLESVTAAVNQAVRIQKFFPKVAELRELVEGAVDDRSAVAWGLFLEAVSEGPQASAKFDDPATVVAMDAVFGGWTQACGMLSASCSNEMVASYQKQFARQYLAALNGSREVPMYRPGLAEMSMREGGPTWAGRLPTLRQPVVYVGARKVVALRLAFDVASGRLTDASRAALEKGLEEAKALAVAEVQQLKAIERKALPPAPSEEMATPEEVDELKGKILRLVPRG